MLSLIHRINASINALGQDYLDALNNPQRRNYADLGVLEKYLFGRRRFEQRRSYRT